MKICSLPRPVRLARTDGDNIADGQPIPATAGRSPCYRFWPCSDGSTPRKRRRRRPTYTPFFEIGFLMRAVLAFLAALLAISLLAPVVILVSPFLLVGTLTRLLVRLFEPEYITRDQLIQFDPHFGWRPRPNLDTHHLMVDLFHIRTDPDGWRGRATLPESDIVVVGDSFADGYGVSERHFFGNLTTKPRIKPIGIGGYSMVQEYLWMRR